MPLVGAWYALQIRPKFEEISRRVLTGKGYETLLPSYVLPSSKGARIEKPLFPGYLFCRLSSEADGMIVRTPGVTRVVGFGSVWTPLEEYEVANLKRIVQSEILREPWPYLSKGCRVRIDSGPLRGVSGMLASDTSGSKVVILVTLLQRAMAVTLDRSTVITPLPSTSQDQSHGGEARPARVLCAGAGQAA
jgi:transcription antitermination factor NusG